MVPASLVALVLVPPLAADAKSFHGTNKSDNVKGTPGNDKFKGKDGNDQFKGCLLYTSPSPRDS